MPNVMEVTDGTFEKEVLKSDLPVFVDFWAPWCGPCRMVSPIVEELSDEYDGKVKFCKVNTDENQMVASSLGIRSIPTMIIFKDGKPVDAAIGAMPKEMLKDFIDRTIAK